MAVPTTVTAPAIAAAVDGLKDVTNGLFQTLGTMNYNNNKRKVIIEKIKGEVTMYLAKLDAELRPSMEVMNHLRDLYEKRLDDSNLTFDEKRTLLNEFANYMLRTIGC
ncbi:MAG: hypothetical protein IKA80_00390 [Spirochaetaceae bacterium]|nr:hypothetical protein [Spirochaetaceae bacterium]